LVVLRVARRDQARYVFSSAFSSSLNDPDASLPRTDTIKSVWQQKGQLIGQLLSTAHRKLPLQDARSMAKQRAVSAVRNRFTTRSKRRDEALVAPGLPSSNSVTTPVDFNSSSEDDEPPTASEELPFDVGAAQLINPAVGYEDRPQHVRLLSARARDGYYEEPDEMSSRGEERPHLEPARLSYRSGSSAVRFSTFLCFAPLSSNLPSHPHSTRTTQQTRSDAHRLPFLLPPAIRATTR
jgi:hypothetical protein